MPHVSIQFHMLFGELVEFVADVMARYSLAVELERFFPKTTTVVAMDGNFAAEVARFGHVDCLWLLCKPPRCRKYERFYLQVGRVKDDQLEDSQLGGGTDNLEALKILKQVAQQLKKQTTAGIWVISQTGNTGFQKSFRYSAGAAKASRAGRLKLTSTGFTQTFCVDQPADWQDK
jgi:hypothetical protein